MLRLHRDERGQSLVIVLSLITLLFLLGSAIAVHTSVALRATRTSAGQGNDFYAADAATELGIWWQRNGSAGNPPAQTINGITTSTTITAAGGGPGACPAAVSVAWMSGFENGTVIQSNGANNNLAGGFASVNQGGALGIVDTVASPARTGSRALRVAPNAGQSNYAYLEAPNGVTLGPTLVAHLAVRMGVLPTGDSAVFSIGPGTTSGWAHPALFLYYKVSSGKWALGLGSNSITVFQESAVTAVVGTWYSFDIRFPVTASNVRTGDWYIDNAAQPSVTATDGAGGSGSAPRVAFGQNAFLGAAYTAYYDDVFLSTTSANFPIGDINISTIKPDAMGTHNTPGNFQQDDNSAVSATSYQKIVETPMNSTTDFLKQVTASATSYIETTLSDTTENCIRAASTVMAVHPAGTAANNTKTSIFDGATESIVYSGDISIATGTLAYAIRPITPGGAWTQARVNGLKLRFGYGSDINPIVSWDSFLVEVASTTVPSIPATITIVGTGGGSTVSTTYTDVGAGVPSLSTWTTTR